MRPSARRGAHRDGDVSAYAPHLLAGEIMRAHDKRHVVLHAVLLDEGGEDLLNLAAMRDKGGHRVFPVGAEVGPQGLVRHAAPDTVPIDDGTYPDHPQGGIIGFPRKEGDLHARLHRMMRLPAEVMACDGVHAYPPSGGGRFLASRLPLCPVLPLRPPARG